MTNKEIGSLLRERRIDLKYSLEDVAKYCGLSKSTISRWETGRIEEIKRGHIYLLSRILYLPIEILLGLETNEEIESADIINKRNKIAEMLVKIKDLKDLENIELYINTFYLKEIRAN